MKFVEQFICMGGILKRLSAKLCQTQILMNNSSMTLMRERAQTEARRAGTRSRGISGIDAPIKLSTAIELAWVDNARNTGGLGGAYELFHLAQDTAQRGCGRAVSWTLYPLRPYLAPMTLGEWPIENRLTEKIQTFGRNLKACSWFEHLIWIKNFFGRLKSAPYLLSRDCFRHQLDGFTKLLKNLSANI